MPSMRVISARGSPSGSIPRTVIFAPTISRTRSVVCRDSERGAGPEAQRCAGPELDPDARRTLENELRDPANALEYFLPRPLRLVFFGGSAVSCLIATLFNLSSLAASTGSSVPIESSAFINLAIDVTGLAAFSALFLNDQRAAQERVAQRATIRQAQTKFGDRELFVNDSGEKMSRLKEVDDDWILRRLDRWGRQQEMPFLGPTKAEMLQQLVRESKPRTVLEVGCMCGYSTIKMAQALPEGGRIVSIERDWKWVLACKRFLWQSSRGSRNTARKDAGLTPVGSRASVVWGDALQVIPDLERKGRVASGSVDLLFLDGTPKETLEYLRAAEPLLADGATVVADNAGVFKEGGMKGYLSYVRGSENYESSFLAGKMGWRTDVDDGLEVSVFRRAQ